MMKRLGLVVLAVLALAYLGAAAYMGINQRSFLFRVDATPAPAAASGLPQAEDVVLTEPSGETLAGWLVRPQRADAPVIIYFHGNAGTLMRRVERFRLLTQGGAGLIAFHYRGYGGSTGTPGEGALTADAWRIFHDAVQRFSGRKLVLYGESLGSGVATQLATKVQAEALILDSPFLSILDRASKSYPWLPVSWLLNHPFRSDLAMPQVRMPLLVLHGARDRVVPISEGEHLFALAREPKVFVRFDDAGHVAAFRHGGTEHIRRFLKERAGLDL